jgi:hypothetical protein
MTEKQAKTKWCPMADYSYDATDCKCIVSDCMWWVQDSAFWADKNGNRVSQADLDNYITPEEGGFVTMIGGRCGAVR